MKFVGLELERETAARYIPWQKVRKWTKLWKNKWFIEKEIRGVEKRTREIRKRADNCKK